MYLKMIVSLVAFLVAFNGILAEKCAVKMFDGRPKEYRTQDGKVIEWFDGYWTLSQCKEKCQNTPHCEEFRIKKNARVSYSGCVLMKKGTTYSGQFTTSFEMYKLTRCPPRCAVKMFDGRPKEFRTNDGKTIDSYGGYWTLSQCNEKCQNTPLCEEFRIKKSSRVSYSGCVLMKKGTTYSGQFTTSFEMYKLTQCHGSPQCAVRETAATYGGQWTLDSCKAKCEVKPFCRESRLKEIEGNTEYNRCGLIFEVIKCAE